MTLKRFLKPGGEPGFTVRAALAEGRARANYERFMFTALRSG
jgi:hypothetical protein